MVGKIVDKFSIKKPIPNLDKPGSTGKILPEKVIFELNESLTDRDIIVTEVDQNQMFCAHYLEIRKPRTWITSGGLGTMGFGFPAAMGAKVAKPDHEVWCVAGDGSFQMNLPELATLKQHNIKVIVLILNNQYLGMVRQWQELFLDKRYAGTPLSCEDGCYYPNFVGLANNYGFEGIDVFDPNKVGAAIEMARKSKESFLINVHIESESNMMPMLPPNSPITKFVLPNGEIGNLYDKFMRLPKTENELKKYQGEIHQETSNNWK